MEPRKFTHKMYGGPCPASSGPVLANNPETFAAENLSKSKVLHVQMEGVIGSDQDEMEDRCVQFT